MPGPETTAATSPTAARARAASTPTAADRRAATMQASLEDAIFRRAQRQALHLQVRQFTASATAALPGTRARAEFKDLQRFRTAEKTAQGTVKTHLGEGSNVNFQRPGGAPSDARAVAQPGSDANLRTALRSEAVRKAGGQLYESHAVQREISYEANIIENSPTATSQKIAKGLESAAAGAGRVATASAPAAGTGAGATVGLVAGLASIGFNAASAGGFADVSSRADAEVQRLQGLGVRTEEQEVELGYHQNLRDQANQKTAARATAAVISGVSAVGAAAAAPAITAGTEALSNQLGKIGGGVGSELTREVSAQAAKKGTTGADVAAAGIVSVAGVVGEELVGANETISETVHRDMAGRGGRDVETGDAAPEKRTKEELFHRTAHGLHEGFTARDNRAQTTIGRSLGKGAALGRLSAENKLRNAKKIVETRESQRSKFRAVAAQLTSASRPALARQTGAAPRPSRPAFERQTGAAPRPSRPALIRH